MLTAKVDHVCRLYAGIRETGMACGLPCGEESPVPPGSCRRGLPAKQGNMPNQSSQCPGDSRHGAAYPGLLEFDRICHPAPMLLRYVWCRGAAARLAVGQAMRGAIGRTIRPTAAAAPVKRGAHRWSRVPRTRCSGGAKPEPGSVRLAPMDRLRRADAIWSSAGGPGASGRPGVPVLVAHRRGRGLFVGGTGDSGEVGFR